MVERLVPQDNGTRRRWRLSRLSAALSDFPISTARDMMASLLRSLEGKDMLSTIPNLVAYFDHFLGRQGLGMLSLRKWRFSAARSGRSGLPGGRGSASGG